MEFLMALIIFPLISFLFGVFGQILIKKVYIVVGITFVGWLIATFTMFNYTFLIWVFVYSVLALIGSAIVCFTQKTKND
jgi:hypothetical protein